MTAERARAALLDYRQRSDAYAAAHARGDRLAVLYLLRLRCARRLWDACLAQLPREVAAGMMAQLGARRGRDARGK